MSATPAPHIAATLDRVAAYRTMRTIRRFEECCLELAIDGRVAGSLHPALGQEAIPAAACAVLEERDRVIATYRGHGWAVACGVPLDGLFGEICGRASGVNGGRGGSPYLSSPDHGFLGENSIVGGGLPIACGVGLALQRRGDGGAVLVSFGDGATSQGASHEAMVMAVARKLPVVFVCENNGWSEMTPIAAIAGVERLSDRAGPLGMVGLTIDGNDPTTVYEATANAVARARRGEGPTFIECVTARLAGHYNKDAEHYRPEKDREAAQAADPVHRLRDALAGENLDAVDREVDEVVAAAVTAALAAPLPDPATAGQHVVAAPARAADAMGRDSDDERDLTLAQAVNRALRRELEDRPDVVVFGEDVAIPGGVFGVTQALVDRFGGDRVFDTPIAEAAILGSAVGSSMEGLRPIVEIMWADFLLVALDQLVNQAANVRYLHRGERHAPMVVRCQQGVAPGSCAQHSQSLEAMLAHVPGLRVGLPSTPQDAYDMLRSAVADPDPVVLIEARTMYAMKAHVRMHTGPAAPIGGARTRRHGGDISLITWGNTTPAVLAAAETLAEEGYEATVLDLRWLSPLDVDAIAETVSETGRALVVHEANLTGGFGGEVVARITERCFFDLDAPVRRLAPPDVRFPAAPALVEPLLPTPGRIVVVARDLLAL